MAKGKTVAMIRPAWFLGISAVFVLGISFLISAVPDADPFSTASENSSIFLDDLTAGVVAELKNNHARRHGRYDIGLFGNSRSLNVSNSHLKIDGCSFFNFSIGGESLRSTVAQLEQLASGGAAPRIAVIAVDNFELQRYNNPIFPMLSVRWRLLVRDLMAGMTRPDITLYDTVRMGWRHAIIESRLFKQILQVEYVFGSLRRRFGLTKVFSAAGLGRTGYRGDGSRVPPPMLPDRKLEAVLTPTSPQILFGYLKYDLERLKRVQDRGTRMVLYETYLEPRSARFFARMPSPYAAATRARFLSLCREFLLRCHAAPETVPLDELPWRDHSHAPAESTGAYLTNLLADDTRRCKRDI
jgi:hypothetical protein